MGIVGLIVKSLIAAITVFGVAGGIGYWLWKKTRPKKQTWKAYIYQLGEGVREPKGLGETNFVSVLLQDLKPYAVDILEKIDIDIGMIRYELQTMKMNTPPIEGDFVENWGKEKVVNLLYHKGGVTFLKQGYDKKSGEAIFQPIPQDTINIVKQEIASRQARIKKSKDILEAISPWIVAGVLVLGLVAISYALGGAYVNVAKQNVKASSIWERGIDKLIKHDTEMMEWRYGVLAPPTPTKLGAINTEANNNTIVIT